MLHINYGYPDDFVNEYALRGYSASDPVAKDMYGIYGVSFWGDAINKHGIPQELLHLCHDFNLTHSLDGQGYSCGMRNAKNNEKGVILFSGLPRKERHETILTLITPHLHEAISRILGKAPPSLPLPPTLSIREKEILEWLANGKSTWDVSTILQISERTVKFHIDNIMKKLDAVNRTHAVAIALKERLIEID
jgi:DNA-binding CsgD family transcriptional regulator